jgi:hypothetical protein
MKTALLPLEHSSERSGQALARFGYSPAEADFLRLAALHGGYFLRRQAAEFLGRKDSGVTSQLIQRALDQGHATSSAYGQTLLYHLGSRPFYEALGEGDNRNRRLHELAQIKQRVMTLDFVLAHKGVTFLASERERLAFFDGLGTPRNALPQRSFTSRASGRSTTRYFVDKDPIFVLGAGTPDAVKMPSFVFVDEGLVTLSRFRRFLDSHRRLFEALGAFALVYVAGSGRHFASAEALFERVIFAKTPTSERLDVRPSERLVAYFELRKRFEERQFATFSREELLRLRDAKHAFSGPNIEREYQAWRASSDPDCGGETTTESAKTTPASATFSTELLNHDYALFDHVLDR